MTIPQLIDNLLAGDKRALARAITIVERSGPAARDLVHSISAHVGRSYTVGITGPPGAGKSTLVDRITSDLRTRGWNGSPDPKVGILAADPTSPFTGGAILADRVRMQRHYRDPGVYIRSMATRGSQGGLPKATRDAVKLLDVYGTDVTIVETVGVGQAELDIMGLADTVVVAVVPEGGDAMQAMKAGLMEIADLFVVNKADRPGADAVVRDISAVISWDTRPREWIPRVLSTRAVEGVGIDKLVDSIGEHKGATEKSGLLARRRRERRKQELFEIIRDRVDQEAHLIISSNPDLANLDPTGRVRHPGPPHSRPNRPPGHPQPQTPPLSPCSHPPSFPPRIRDLSPVEAIPWSLSQKSPHAPLLAFLRLGFVPTALVALVKNIQLGCV